MRTKHCAQAAADGLHLSDGETLRGIIEYTQRLYTSILIVNRVAESDHDSAQHVVGNALVSGFDEVADALEKAIGLYGREVSPNLGLYS